jgi:hypothetical protein
LFRNSNWISASVARAKFSGELVDAVIGLIDKLLDQRDVLRAVVDLGRFEALLDLDNEHAGLKPVALLFAMPGDYGDSFQSRLKILVAEVQLVGVQLRDGRAHPKQLRGLGGRHALGN